MGGMGFEPMAFRTSSERSTNWANRPLVVLNLTQK